MVNWRVWAVHLLTATGAALALLAMVATAHDDWRAAYLFLGAALIVDGIDGPLARRLRVAEAVPWFDGALLDFVVDYATYVLVPAFMLVRSGILAEPYATGAGIVVAVVGALYFADTRMKTPDAAFRGFPAVWNVVIFQLMVYKWPAPLTLFVIAAFAVLTFFPVEFVHPIRVKRLRPLTLIMAAIWAVLALIALFSGLEPAPAVTVAFMVVSAYFAGIGAYLQLTRDRG